MSTTSELLSRYHTIAVVGLSANAERPSRGVAHYLLEHGYRVIPINPSHAGTSILGQACYASLAEAAAALAGQGERIEIVDCFRQASAIEPIVQEAIAIGAKCVWMQLGVVNEQAAKLARANGLEVVMDRCMKIEHAHMAPSGDASKP